MNNRIYFSLLLKNWWKYFSRIFSVVLSIGFIISNVLSPNLWSIQTARASFNGLATPEFSTENGADWTITVSNDGSSYQGGEPITAQFGAYHCNIASSQACAPDFGLADFDRTLGFDNSVTFNAPSPGQTIQLTRHNDIVSCGRVQADLGLASPAGAIIGGIVFNTGQNCGTTPPPPSSQCSYGSTQARWQRDSSDPWDQNKTINVGQSARAGGFHDNTGQFANDITLTITGPGTNTTVGNGGSFTPSQAGTYQLKVTTNNQSGEGCEDTATLTVNSAPVAQCIYGSTQARVQKDLSDPWDSSKTINSGDQIRVGGFHDATGLLANDVNLNVFGPMNFGNLGNGQFITPTAAGSYTLAVTTQNQGGPACEDRASFEVQAVAPPPQAPPCDASQLNMSVSPNPSNIGDSVTFSLGGSQGSTWIGDSWSGGVDCSDGFWGSKTCRAISSGNFIWIHTWQNTAPNNFDIRSPQCSKTINFSVQSVVTPTPTGTPVPTPTPTATPRVTPAPTTPPQGGLNCPAGTISEMRDNVLVCIQNTNTNNNTNTSSSSSYSYSTNTITFGNIGTGTSVTPAVVTTPVVTTGQILGVKELPKTGLPAIAWSALAFIPAGFRLRRFSKIKKDLQDDPQFIWEDRKFKIRG